MFKTKLFVFAMIFAIVAVSVMEASPEPGHKAESYQNQHLRAYHPTKVEIKIQDHGHHHGSSGGGGGGDDN